MNSLELKNGIKISPHSLDFPNDFSGNNRFKKTRNMHENPSEVEMSHEKTGGL